MKCLGTFFAFVLIEQPVFYAPKNNDESAGQPLKHDRVRVYVNLKGVVLLARWLAARVTQQKIPSPLKITPCAFTLSQSNMSAL